MINLEKLTHCKPAFGFFAQTLTYPEKRDFQPDLFNGAFDPSSPGYESAKAYWEQIHGFSMEKIEEAYVETFDFDKHSTLYMTFPKFGDTKERGQMLARLKVMYEMFGLQMPEEELSDYLPLMCEFIYAAEWEDDSHAEESFRMFIAVLEDGTFHLLNALKENESPYYHLVKSLRDTVKSCIIEGSEKA
ncbi:nitrate reductase molybdenum cofactor assembly chaperone [Bacillus sp. 1P06AnD]|uniref:nitrate reductase molybdenum cofactor assembly chaperone n=1 Tax=Bacillus sp. 1P06AnD TaxID=3132208 RepID=UPI0039A34CA3